MKLFVITCRIFRIGVEFAMVAATLSYFFVGSDRTWKIALLLAVIDVGTAIKEHDI